MHTIYEFNLYLSGLAKMKESDRLSQLSHHLRLAYREICKANLNDQGKLFIDSIQPLAIREGYGVKVLPPWMGEMGSEIRYFLGEVEPYLANGWKIFSRRPALYPKGSAIYDGEYFSKIDNLISQFACHFPTLETCGVYLTTKTRMKYDFVEDVSKVSRLSLETDTVQHFMSEAVLELALRKLFSNYIEHPDRALTSWDEFLLSVHIHDYYHRQFKAPIRPSYFPEAFIKPKHKGPEHVGVQLRAIPKKFAERRNSDVKRVMSYVNQVSDILKLPVIVYGIDGGNVFPDGIDRSRDFFSNYEDHFCRELMLLRSCKVMFSPDSGWTDLMSLLKIPTFLEKMIFKSNFYGMEHFEPRIKLLSDTTCIKTQLTELLEREYQFISPNVGVYGGALVKENADIVKRQFTGRDRRF